MDLTGFDDWEIEKMLLHTEDDDEPMSFIDDLLQNDYVGGASENKRFSITFVFDIEYKEDLEKYIKENGKESLVNLMVKEVQAC